MRTCFWFPVVAILVFASSACNRPRTITVSQSGTADVIGSDSAALRKAASLLRAGDTLVIGPGTYQMDNSLVVPSGVTVRGTAGRTILRKSRCVESLLTEDADNGETFLRVAQPEKFRAGMGITILDDNLNSGWDISISTITEANADGTLRITPMTTRDYDQQTLHARVRSVFPILVVTNAENVVLEDLIVDGNKEENPFLNGNRGGAIYFYLVRNITVRRCTARNFNGDGISFQITDGVRIVDSESHGHTSYGIHPGSGSARAVVRNCRLHNNAGGGLYLCWRVRHGQFTGNVIEDNGRFGISIGHKDTDNEFVDNTIARNGISGVYFRNENIRNAGHRNTFRKNKVLDNGGAGAGYGFYILPLAGGIVLEDNQIANTRPDARTQRYGIYKVTGAGAVRQQNNAMSGHSEGDYREGPVAR